MTKFYEWLDDEPKGWRYWKFLFISLIWLLVYERTAAFIVADCRKKASSQDSSRAALVSTDAFSQRENEMVNLLQNYPWWMICLFFFFGGLWEEISFRWMPLFPAVKGFGKSIIVILIALLSSVIFGWQHGHFTRDGAIFISIQGVIGLVLSLVYLKCGALRNKNFKAFLSSFFVHFMFNIVIISPFLVLYYIAQNHPEVLDKLENVIK